MNVSACIDDGCLGGDSPSGSGALAAWAKIFVALVAVLIFMFWIGPWGLQTSAMKPVADTIEEYGIEANAYYYTEVPEFFEAQVYFDNAMRYSHK